LLPGYNGNAKLSSTSVYNAVADTWKSGANPIASWCRLVPHCHGFEKPNAI